MNTVPTFHLSAFCHRQWYLPGETVRVQVYLECAREIASTKKNVFVPPSPAPRLNYFSVDEAFEGGERDSDVHVERLCTALAAECRTNASVLSYDWGTLPAAIPTTNVAPSSASHNAHSHSNHGEGDQVYRELFRTRWMTITEDDFFRSRQCRSYTFSFRLPADTPPTMSLKEFGTRTQIALVARWTWCKGQLDGAKPQEASMLLPVTVFNAATAISHFSFGAAFPLARGEVLGKSRFEFAAMPLPTVPSSSISAPLEDSLYPSEAQRRSFSSAYGEEVVSRQNQLADMRDPVTVMVPVGNSPRALEVRLLSTFVSIGSSVQGVLVDCTSPLNGDVLAVPEDDSASEASPVLVKAVISLEMLECCPAAVAKEAGPSAAVHGVDGVALIHSYPTRTQEWVLLDSPSTPFSFPLVHESLQPTILTDVSVILWQLRIKIQWTTAANLAMSVSKGVSTLAMCTVGPELVIPLTIVPPHVPSHPRRGQIYSTFFSS